MNMMLGTFTASLAESLTLAEKAGLDQYILLEILNLSGLSCDVVKSKGEAIMEVSHLLINGRVPAAELFIYSYALGISGPFSCQPSP